MTDWTADDFEAGDVVRFVYWASNRQSKEDRTLVADVTDVKAAVGTPGTVTITRESGEKYTAWEDGRVTSGPRNKPNRTTVGYGPRLSIVERD